MRFAFAFLLLAIPLQAADPPLLPSLMEVGKAGKLPKDGESLFGTDVIRYYVSEVGTDWLAIRVTGEREGPSLFIVRGVETKGLVDDKRWPPSGEWKVEGTEKYKGKTVFMLKPVKPKK